MHSQSKPEMKVSIRPFRPSDLPAIQTIRQAAFKPVFQSFREILGEEIYLKALGDPEAEQAALLDRLCSPDAQDEVFVATIGHKPVGFVSYSLDRDGRRGEIGLNAVHPDHAGRGIGTRMYEFVLTRMKERGVAVVTVGTGGDPSHAPARRAYEKVGFGPAVPSMHLYRLL